MAALPFVAFFLSGASSLIFQMIWSRLLHHVFGSSSVAISSVVSVFMGGLALGAWIFGRYADRVRRPLRLYAWAELGVALFALAVPVLTGTGGWLAAVNSLLRERFGSESTGLLIARFLCIVPILIVPTTLMGATLPLLARHFVGRGHGAKAASTRVGALYAVNTTGAVAGVFLGGFVLLPRFGVSVANGVAVAMNLALAAGIFALGRKLPAATDAATSPTGVATTTHEPGDDIAPYPRPVRFMAALAFAVSGFCSLVYEVVWSRALINTIGASVYAFALILMTFLVGIAGGSALASFALGAGTRLLSGMAVAAGCVSAVALLPVAIRHGVGGLAACSVGAILALGAILAGQRRRARQDALFAAPATNERAAPLRWLSALVAVPLTISLALVAIHHGRLEYLTCSLAFAAAALLVLLVGLRRRVVMLLAGLQLYIAVSTLVGDIWADEVSLTFASMVVPLYESLGAHVDTVLGLMFVTAALCVLPSALGMGAMFPLTMRVFGGGGQAVGREVGVVYTGNTVGSIIGAWLPGFVLMPTFGMQPTLHVAVAINLLLAAAVVLAARSGRARGLRELMSPAFAYPVVAAVPALIAAVYVASAAPGAPLAWNLSKMTLGVFRISLARDVLDEEAWGEPDLVYYKDGLSTTVSVERWGRHYSLKNNGKVEASNGDDMPTQIMVAALPLLLHQRGPEGLDVAIIGLGSGVTVGAAMQFPVRSVEVIELERSVADASRFFADVNHLEYRHEHYPFIEMPRLHLINDDGRNYLAGGSRRYDVIVSEPSNPWITGVSDLFTVDHFQVAKRRLAPGGVYCQWVQLYEMSPENVKIIYRTFASQWKHVLVFSAEDLSSDTVLVGSDSPLPLDLPRVRRALTQPSIAAELERAYIHSPFDVFARILLSDKREVMSYAQHEERLRDGRWQRADASTNREPCPPESCRRHPAPLNTDDNALIEFAAPRDLIGFERYKGYLGTIYTESWPYGRLGGALSGFGSGAEASANYAEQALSLVAHGRKREARAMLAEGARHGASATLDLARRLTAALGGAEEPALGLEPPEPAGEIGEHARQRARTSMRSVMDWLARGDHERARAELKAMPSSLARHLGPAVDYLTGYLAFKVDAFDDAVGELENLARDAPRFALEHPQLYYFLARAHDGLQHFDKAVRDMKVYLAASALAPQADPDADDDSARGAATTDAEGESDKALHAGAHP